MNNPKNNPEAEKEITNKERANIISHTQFIKDVSFENPGILSKNLKTEKPKINVICDVNSQPIGEDVYDVTLKIEVEAKINENPIFIIDLSYSGIFTLKQIEEKEKESILLIYCPNLLFPFIRQIIYNLSLDGGHPPLILNPIDFAYLYKKYKNNQEKDSNNTIN